MGLRPVLSAEASIEPLPVHPGRTHVQLRHLAEPLFSSPIPQQPVHHLYHLMGTQRNQCCTLFKAERFRFTLIRKHLQQLKKPHRSGGNVRKVLKTDLRKFKGICSARHQTAVFVTALPRSSEWDPRGRRPACPPADRGRGAACPTCGGGVYSLVPRGEKSPRTRRPAPRRWPGSHPNAAQRKKRFPSTYPGHFEGKKETENQNFLENFSQGLQAPINRNSHCPTTHAIELGNFLDSPTL